MELIWSKVGAALLKLRILTALVGIPLLIFIVWQGSYLLLLFTGMVLIVGTLELMNLFQNSKLSPSRVVSLLGVLLLLTGAYLNKEPYPDIYIVFIVIVNLLWLVLVYPGKNYIDAAVNFFGIFYIGLIINLYLLRQMNNGFYLVLFTFIVTWATDTFAYFTGIKFGKHKLAPKLSPNKTVEGAVGGLLGSVATGLSAGYLMPQGNVITFALLGFLLGIVAQVGDLVESAIKRHAGVKDTGRLVPGHGGVLDRFDSLLFTLTTVYYFFRYLG